MRIESEMITSRVEEPVDTSPSVETPVMVTASS
jgi:hypothetical protein